MDKITKVIIGIIATAIIVRIFLLFLAPISMFADPVIRFLPAVEKVMHLDFSFHDMPLFILLEAFWMLFLSGKWLWIAWKLTSFIFFIAILFLLPSIFKKLNLNKKEQVMLLALFLFSTWSLLLSTTIMQDIMLTFFVLALFLSIENYLRNPKAKWIADLIFLTALMILTKQTGYLLLAGFILYILGKKVNKVEMKKKTKTIFYLAIGALLTIFWPIKNYITLGKAFIGIHPPAPSIHSVTEYLSIFAKTYHYFWEIPILEKVSLQGIFSTFYLIFYISAILVTAIISVTTLVALIKYSKKHKEYIALLLPIFSFVFYWVFIIFLGFNDAGRYTFPLWIFLFFFPVKFISEIKKPAIKKVFYLLVIAFCVLSVISAFGITLHMRNIDSQILSVNNALRQQNATGTFITNDEFTSSALTYYLKQPVKFNLTRNIRDTGVPCQGEHVFFTENFDVFKEQEEYRICRW